MARVLVEKNLYYDDEKKSYYIHMDFGRDSKGKRIRKHKTFKTIEEARKALADFQDKKKNNSLLIADEITVEEWLNLWLGGISDNISPSTLYGYKNIINRHLIPDLGDIKLNKLGASHIEAYYKNKLTGPDKSLTTNTLRKHHSLLKTALSAALEEAIIQTNPMDKMLAPKYIKIKEETYSLGGTNHLLELLLSRRSIRKFTKKKIENDKIDIIIKGALAAPSAINIKPWELIIVDDESLIAKLGQTRRGASLAVKNAPLTIVVVADPNKTKLWIEDASIISAYIQLQAHSIGLASCWVQVRDEGEDVSKGVKEVLAIPSNFEVLSMIALGYPDEEKEGYDISQLAYEKVHYNRFL